jgi:putative SOS response-associated peptidase YedK
MKMCGRFTITTDKIEIILNHFEAKLAPNFTGYQPRFNAAPGQVLPAIVSKEDGQRYLLNTFWGFIPPWGEKTEGKTSYQINIRDDTIARNKFFTDRLVNNRCIIPADGFYEWEKTGEPPRGVDIKRSISRPKKTPYYIKLKSGKLFAFAGLWRSVKIEEKPIISTAIITTNPNNLISSIHDRMPVILSEDELKVWLNPEVKEFELLHRFLDSYPEKEMKMHPVSTFVNSGRNDSPACIEPVT